MENQPEHEPDEDDHERADGNVVGEVPMGKDNWFGQQEPGEKSAKFRAGVRQERREDEGLPWYPKEELLLDRDEVCKDAKDGRRRNQHEQHPKVQLDGRPVVLVDALDATLVYDRAACVCCGHGACGYFPVLS